MRCASLLALTGTLTLLWGCGTADDQADQAARVTIALDLNTPANSSGTLQQDGESKTFKVGYGKYGIGCADSTFEEGVTPLGTFKVNAILSDQDFKMVPELVERSGKSEDYLKQNLFKNMSAIDFKGDGETGEYGTGYISLEPVGSAEQPFRFNDYDGKFRWYSFAIHGTNDESRVGQKVTGGCVNVSNTDLNKLLEAVELGDEVIITANGPCNS